MSDIKLVQAALDEIKREENPEAFDSLTRILDMLRHQNTVQRKSRISTNQILFDL
jgi:hypothetical protein